MKRENTLSLALVTLTGKWWFYSQRSYSLRNKQAHDLWQSGFHTEADISLLRRQQMFAFIGVLCGSLSAAQRGRRRIKTGELRCFGVRTHICHPKSHFMGASDAHACSLPRPSAPSHRALRVCIFKNGRRRRRSQRKTFYPRLPCLHCSEKQTISLTHCTVDAVQQPLLPLHGSTRASFMSAAQRKTFSE